MAQPGRAVAVRGEPTLECSLVRRLVPKREWRQEGFREAFYDLPAERVTIGFVE